MSYTLTRLVVSPSIYALILTSPRLRKALIPEGLITTPYEVLNYHSTLTLHDRKGSRATFERTQQVRFVQDGVSAILDHAWGDGIIVTHYYTNAGSLGDSFKDQGRRHLVIELRKQMCRGQSLEFEVERTIMEGFWGEGNWWEINIDHPVHHLQHSVVFPKSRSCWQATLQFGNNQLPLPVSRLSDGRVVVQFKVKKPFANIPYKVSWKW